MLGDRLPGSDDLPLLRYTTRVVNEALRLYPQPPVLIRRAMQVRQEGGEGDVKAEHICTHRHIFLVLFNTDTLCPAQHTHSCAIQVRACRIHCA